MKVCNSNLAALPNVLVPTYNRQQLSAGIVHIGVGNFHRAHQSWYLQQLFQKGLNYDWAIVGAGVRPQDAVMREKLQAQDFLTTLVQLDPRGKSAEIVGSMIDYVPVQADNQALIKQLADPRIRIVSLTVTEGGYFIDFATGDFMLDHQAIKHDIANPHRPVTAFGAIIAALRIRRDKNYGPFTIQSCDNLTSNGEILKKTVLSLARALDRELASWIADNCSFPSSMVDCIVPATISNALAREFGVDDQVPVAHENFRQWVIEDNFCAGRPALEQVGVVFSNQVPAFEAMKLRVLNGGHQLVADVGELLGIKTIAEAMAEPRIRNFFCAVEYQEIAPHIEPVPGYSAVDYVQLIEQRLLNPEILDTTRRVAFDGSSRHPAFILPSVRDALKTDSKMSGLSLVSAAWARYCHGQREDGSQIAANDPNWEELRDRAQLARQNPQVWLENKTIYGDLAENRRFSQAFERWLPIVYEQGILPAIDIYLAEI